MSTVKINMIGGGFQHDICSSALNKNKYVQWVKDNSSNISVHIDNGILMNVNVNKLNFGWFAESSSIIPSVISEVTSKISEYKEKYKFIFTHDKRIVNLNPSFFKFTLPNALPWIQKKNIYNKNKFCSFIVSNKNWTKGHNFRLEALNKYKDKIDHYGRGFKTELPWTFMDNSVEESGKILALKDYYFSFCFENDNYESIFCEKITDCFATGTMPIFWGTPNIVDYFDKNGIIIYDENFNFENLSVDLYMSRINSIKNNFEICLDLPTSEDYFYINYIK